MSIEEKIIPINIEDEMKTAYIDYSMSVIVSRALPDVRDGLKPVHRRVLFGMYELGVTYNKAHKKSARIVGEVLGKYHPHGDSSVYDTMVRMAQNWSLRYPLVDGQGNFGSVDGDSPAAMRYTEARTQRITEELLSDLDKETVDFQNNFDDTLQEPTVMPTKFPNLLVNGASGIAVGMATNMLPHNLTEVIEGILAYMDDYDISITELTKYIKAPDMPTGGTIYGVEGVKQAYLTGRGRVVVRGKADIINEGGRDKIIITEIPYQVNKAILITRIAELVNEKKIEGISDINDESDRQGMRIVVELKRDANPSVVLSHLYKYTALQNSYGVNNICLVNGRPELLNLKDLIVEYVKFRLEVVTRRTQFELRKAKDREHILKGLLAALDRLDEVIALIRRSANGQEAMEGLMAFDFTPRNNDAVDQLLADLRLENDHLSEVQAREILNMRLQRLTGLERDKLKDEFIELRKHILYLQSILDSEELKKEVIRGELNEIKEKFGDARRTQIEHAEGEISIEDMIDNEEVVVTISHLGYIKRTPVTEYRTQGRGGRGAQSSGTRDSDFIEQMFVTFTHNYLLLFTTKGRCYWMRVYEIPKGAKTGKGRVIQNIVQIPSDDKIKAYRVVENLNDKEFLENHYIVFCTKNGNIKKSPLVDFSRPRNSGVTAITIKENDELLEAVITDGSSHIVLASHNGQSIRFHEKDVSPTGRGAQGVIGMRFKENDDDENEKTDDFLIGMVCVMNPETNPITLLTVAEKGIGKRSEIDEYRTQGRGGKGIKTMNITEKTGKLVAIKAVTEDDDLMIINKSGISIRLSLNSLRTVGRATQGVRLINLKDDDMIADVAIVKREEEEEDIATDVADMILPETEE